MDKIKKIKNILFRKNLTNKNIYWFLSLIVEVVFLAIILFFISMIVKESFLDEGTFFKPYYISPIIIFVISVLLYLNVKLFSNFLSVKKVNILILTLLFPIVFGILLNLEVLGINHFLASIIYSAISIFVLIFFYVIIFISTRKTKSVFFIQIPSLIFQIVFSCLPLFCGIASDGESFSLDQSILKIIIYISSTLIVLWNITSSILTTKWNKVAFLATNTQLRYQNLFIAASMFIVFGALFDYKKILEAQLLIVAILLSILAIIVLIFLQKYNKITTMQFSTYKSIIILLTVGALIAINANKANLMNKSTEYILIGIYLMFLFFVESLFGVSNTRSVGIYFFKTFASNFSFLVSVEFILVCLSKDYENLMISFLSPDIILISILAILEAIETSINISYLFKVS